jgi:hypothetical protein
VTLMSRQSWTPDDATPAQLRARKAIAAAALKADAAEEALIELVRQGHELGIPMDDLAGQSKRSRATLFRRLKDTRRSDS